MYHFIILSIVALSAAEILLESSAATKQITNLSSGKDDIKKLTRDKRGIRRRTNELDHTSKKTCSGRVDSPKGWYDSDGPFYDCVWYEKRGCPNYGRQYENCGKIASEACCACEGGGNINQTNVTMEDCNIIEPTSTLFPTTEVEEEPIIVEGRPLFSDNNHQLVVAQLQPTVADSLWDQLTNTPPHNETTCDENNIDPIMLLTSDQRDTLAAKWRNSAQYEHASVASFSKFAIHLQTVAAPPDLIRAAHEAAIQEIGHAQLCLSTASLFVPSSFVFGQLPLSSIQIDGTLKSLAYATAVEGAVGETVAAFRAAIEQQLAIKRGGVDHIVDVLDTIMREETQHAVLAWETLHWVLKEASTGSSEREDIMLSISKGLGLKEYDDNEQMIDWPSNSDFPSGFGYLDSAQSRVITNLVKKDVIRVMYNWLFQLGELPLNFLFSNNPDSMLMRVGGNSVSNVANYFTCLMMKEGRESCSWSPNFEKKHAVHLLL